MFKALAADVVEQTTGEVALRATPLRGGQVGRVVRVDTPGRSLVVKFVTATDEPAFADEPADNRVYGARWSNLVPAHRALTAHGLAAPALHALGDLDGEGLRYAVMDHFDGDPDDYSAAWFRTVGRALGEAHAASRGYQGWIGLGAPLVDDWSTAFAESLASRLRDALPLLGSDLHQALCARTADPLRDLQDPAAFVLSHTDGFQGVLRRSGEAWTLLGHIDIEDFQFTDQRFVLAGLELSHALAGRSVPDAFWRAYLAAVDLAPGYAAVRDLFQTYYLLVWAKVLRTDAGGFAQCVRRLEWIAASRRAP
jgi:hypothetical protein